MAKTTRKSTPKSKAKAGADPKQKTRVNPKTRTRTGTRSAPPAENRSRPKPGSLHHYHTLFEHARDGVYLETLEGEIIDINPTGARMLGYEPAELIGTDVTGIVTPEVVDRLGAIAKALLSSKSLTIEAENVRKDGVVIPVEVSLSLVEDYEENLVVAIVRDITDRKRAEEDLRRSEERYRNLMESMRDGVYMLDREGRFTYVNDVIVKRSGQPREWFLKRTYDEVVLPGQRDEAIRNFKTIMRGGKVPIYEVSYPTASGEPLWVELNTTPIFQDGEVVGLLGVSRDIKDRKRAEHALRQSEQTTLAFLNSTKDLAVMIDTEGRVIRLNEAIAAALGIAPEDLVGKVIYDFFPPAVASARRKVASEVIESRQPADYEELLRGRVFANRVYPLLDPEGKVERLAVFATDITERRRAESLRREAEKSQAIAILAGGITQNFRDVLMSMTASTALLRRGLGDAESHAGSLDRLESGCTRISHLVDEVYSIAAKLFPDPSRLQLNESVELAVFALSDRLPDGERFETALAPDLHPIQADRDLVARVLFVILENAAEAVSRGGDIRILTENVSQVPSSIAGKLRTSHGPFLHVHVEDTGTGMTPEELARVFDPFFTTKQTGRGMGMAVAKAVIEHYGGFIFLDSEKGRGTRVHVYMPAEGADHPAGSSGPGVPEIPA